MQISSRFTIALHMMVCMDTLGEQHKITSDFLSLSISVNPVIIRKILSQLKKNEIIEVQRGSGGAKIAKEYDQITFYDIYRAVECVEEGKLFHFHEHPNQACPVGKNIHRVLDDKLQQVQDALENELKKITFADVIKDSKKYIHYDPSE